VNFLPIHIARRGLLSQFIFFLVALLLLAVLLAVYFSEESTVAPTPTATHTPSYDIVDSSNSFALDISKKLLLTGENEVISPFSIYSAFLPVYEAASGDTRKEIIDVFKLPENPILVRKDYEKLLTQLLSARNTTIIIANGLWYQEGLTLVEDTRQAVEKFYKAVIKAVDFIGNPDSARDEINQWIEEKTMGKIKDTIDRLTRYTRAVIVNTIYFNATWIKPFHEIGLRKFQVSENSYVDVEMLNRITNAGYYEDSLLKAVEIPYAGGDYAMVVVLPKTDLGDLVGKLDPSYLEKIRENMDWAEVNITIPKFRVEEKYELVDTLKEMGIVKVFDPKTAELTNLFVEVKEQLFVSRVIHQTYVSVNKWGTEAAAATVVIIEKVSLPLPKYEFNANKPFLYMIIHRDTGLILFIGVITNPAPS